MSLTFAESQLNRETAKKTAKAFANIFYRQQDEAGFTLERHNLIVSTIYTTQKENLNNFFISDF